MGLVVQSRIQGNEGEGLTATSNSSLCFLETKILCSKEAEVGSDEHFLYSHLRFTPVFTSIYKYATFMGKVICWLPLVEPECYVWCF